MKNTFFVLMIGCLVPQLAFSAYGTYLPGSCEKESLALQNDRCICTAENLQNGKLEKINVACHTVQCTQWHLKYNMSCGDLITCNLVNIERIDSQTGEKVAVLCPVHIDVANLLLKDSVCEDLATELNTHHSVSLYCQTSRQFTTPWFYDPQNVTGAIPLPVNIGY